MTQAIRDEKPLTEAEMQIAKIDSVALEIRVALAADDTNRAGWLFDVQMALFRRLLGIRPRLGDKALIEAAEEI